MPSMVYSYRKTGQVATMEYPSVNIDVTYHYGGRKWLDSIVAEQSGALLFRQTLTHDPAGRITSQFSEHAGKPVLQQWYGYDNANRLGSWIATDNAFINEDEIYLYDGVGNRQSLILPNGQEQYSYNGGNRLLSRTRTDPFGMKQTSYTYNADGGVASRTTMLNGLPVGENHLRYSWRELTRQYIDGAPGAPGRTDWRYRYSAGGEREQKRQYYTPNGDNGGNGYRWTYYLLGGKKEQLSVWEGYQTRDWLCGEQPNQWGYVYLWGKEYLSYGVGGTASVVSKPTGETEYRIADHLGSVRVSYNDVTMQTTTVDYAPFGNVIPQGGAVTGLPRQEFIDRERDKESGLGNFGVRQYEYETGRFLGTDPLWEKFPSNTPYHYSHNNPISRLDPSGLDDYKVDHYGYITLVEENDDKQDRLFSVDGEGGIVKDNSMTIDKGILNKRIETKDEYGDKILYMKVRGDDKATKLFEWLAKNTPSAEWGLTMLGKQGKKGLNYISTGHDETAERGSAYLAEKLSREGYHFRRHVHSHPNQGPPSGLPAPYKMFGDIGFARWMAFDKNTAGAVLEIYLPTANVYFWYNKDGDYDEETYNAATANNEEN